MRHVNLSDINPEDKEHVVEFLKDHPVGVIATVDETGDPHASTIYYNADDKLRVTFTTKLETTKYKNITNHSAVMLAIYDAEKQTAVQLSGHAREVTDPEIIREIYHGTLKATHKTGPDIVPPIAKIAAGAYVAFEVDINHIWMTDYGWGENFVDALKHASNEDPGDDPA